MEYKRSAADDDRAELKKQKMASDTPLLTPEEQQKGDEEIVVTDASTPSTRVVEIISAEEWIEFEQQILPGNRFAHHERFSDSIFRRFLHGSHTVAGVLFQVSFRRPNFEEHEWAEAINEGRDKMHCTIQVLPNASETREYGEEVWIEWSAKVRMAIGDANYRGDNTELTFDTGLIRSSAASRFRHTIDLCSYAFATDPENGYMRRGHRLHFALRPSIHATSFMPPRIERVLGAANADSNVCLRTDDGRLFYTNKLLLSLHSDVFRVMFSSEFREKSAKVIRITDAESSCVQHLLLSLYPEGVEITNDNVEGLLEMAHRYNVAKTVRACYDFLMKDTENNYFLRCRLAEQYTYIHMFDKAVADLHKDTIKTDAYYDELSDECRLRIMNGLAELGRAERERAEEARQQRGALDAILNRIENFR